MPTKRKFNAKFPTARIKKIMQVDDEIGKLSATVPPVVSRALELFVDELLTKAYELSQSRCSKTILPSDIKEIIDNESGFAFLKPLVSGIPSLKSLEKAPGPRGRLTSVDGGQPSQRKSAKRSHDNVKKPSHSKRNGQHQEDEQEETAI